MSAIKIGKWLFGVGICGAVFSLLSDLLPGSNPGIQATQLLGLEIASVFLFIGAWLLLSGTDTKMEFKEAVYTLAGKVDALPVIVWVLAGFFISYLGLFVAHSFLNTSLRMEYFVKYLPDRYPIGNDLIAVLDQAKGWFVNGQSPYQIQFYPPFAYILFSPLTLVDDYPKLFASFTLFSVAIYVVFALILPVKFVGTKNLPMILLFFLTSLFSYGFHFELERGQYNILASLLCLSAIYIFHNHKSLRVLAYVLFTLSVQLKLYPAIFIVLFVDDWMDWKPTLRRFISIGFLNFALLFSLGWRSFLEFMDAVILQVTTPTWNMDVNHSAKSFVDVLARGKLEGFPVDWQVFAQNHAGQISANVTVIFLIAFVLAIVFSQARRRNGADMYLLLTCALGTLILPVSMDYKLSILAVPMALFLSVLPETKNRGYKIVSTILIMGVSTFYSSLLVPFKYKPDLLHNSFPPLFFILIFVTILNIINYKDHKLQMKSL